MSKKRFISLGVVVIFVLVSFTVMSKSDDQMDEVKLRANEGELVWIILNHVKPDKRQQFEEFLDVMYQVWMDLQKEGKLSNEEVKAYMHMRTLHPTKANEDGSYTYVFLADPWIEGVESRIGPWLRKKYSEEEAKKYGQMFSDSLMRPQESYMSKQAEYIQ